MVSGEVVGTEFRQHVFSERLTGGRRSKTPEPVD